MFYGNVGGVGWGHILLAGKSPPSWPSSSMEQERLVKDDSEQLKLEISRLKDELKAKNTQLELLNKVNETWKFCHNFASIMNINF
jgi:hypothetical protein